MPPAPEEPPNDIQDGQDEPFTDVISLKEMPPPGQDEPFTDVTPPAAAEGSPPGISPPQLRTEESISKRAATDFISLVLQDNNSAVKVALQADPRLAESCNPRGIPVLLLAIEEELPIITRLLIEAGASTTVHCLQASGRPDDTPLRAALRSSRPFIKNVVVRSFLEDQVEQQSASGLCATRHVEAVVESSMEKREVRRALVEFYSEATIDELSSGIAKSFVAMPARTLLDLLELAAATSRMALRSRRRDPSKADGLMSASHRLQLAAGGCLASIGEIKDALRRFDCDELLRSPMGTQSLSIAIKNRMGTYLTQKEVQGFFLREWRGELLNQALEGSLEQSIVDLARFAAALLFSLLLLPLVAVVPRAETSLYEWLCLRDFRQRVDFVEAHLKQRSNSGRQLRRQMTSRAIMKKGFNVSAAVVGLSQGKQRATTVPGGSRISPAATAHAAGPESGGDDTPHCQARFDAPDDEGAEISRPAPVDVPDRAKPPRISKAFTFTGLLSDGRESTSTLMTQMNQVMQGHHTLFSFYLLRTPCVKYGLRVLSDLSLAILLSYVNLASDLYPAASWVAPPNGTPNGTHLRPGNVAISPAYLATHGHDRHERPFVDGMTVLFACWALGGALSEYRKIGRTHDDWYYEVISLVKPDRDSMYRSDLFNIVDLTTWHLLLAAVFLEPGGRAKVVCWSLATYFSWIRVLRVLQLFSSFGPLVLMFVSMLKDVLKLLVLIAFIVVATTSGLYVLFNSIHYDFRPSFLSGNVAVTEWPPPLPAACEPFADLAGQLYEGWASLSLVLFSGSITGAAHPECLMAAADSYLVGFAFLYSYVFFILCTVLLLNMLIAMMAKTFDNVWEANVVNHQMLFAMNVHFQSDRPPEPPPFNIVRVPWYVLQLILRLIGFWLPDGWAISRILSRLDGEIELGFEFSRNVDATDSVARNLDPKTNDYVGLDVAGHCTFRSWRRSVELPTLIQSITAHVTEHEDESTQQERWRSKMLKRITSVVHAYKASTHRGMSRQEEALAKLQAQMTEVLAALGKGKQASPP